MFWHAAARFQQKFEPRRLPAEAGIAHYAVKKCQNYRKIGNWQKTMITRRSALIWGSSAIALGSTWRFAWANDEILEQAVLDSDLIYLTPIRSDGSESRCQAEVWFVPDGEDLFVVTQSSTWRAHAPRLGLDRARVWVGDLGVWGDTGGKYRSLPQLEAVVSYVRAADVQERVLNRFGDKYTMEWVIWGPRWRKGLADGSRVMLRYRPAAV